MPIATGKSGFSPVGVVLQASLPDIHTVAAHAVNWNQATDNLWDANVLAALPAGIGFTALLNGTDGTITTTAAGTWAFSWNVRKGGDSDATYVGYLNDGLGAVSYQYLSQRALGATLASVVATLPSGTSFPPAITTESVGAGTDSATVQLVVARLA